MKPPVDPLAQPARLGALRALHREGLLSDAAMAEGVRMLRPGPVWLEWLSRILLLIGAPLILAGVVFFFAYNWSEMPRGLKLALCQAGVLGCVVAHAFKGGQKLSGQVGLVGAMVLVGVWLAVFGQIYQTGADAYELFVGWAVLITGWVLISRFAAAWLLWIVLWNLALVLYWEQAVVANLSGHDHRIFWLLALLNGTALVATEMGARLGVTWLRGRWLPILLLSATIIAMSLPALECVLGWYGGPSMAYVALWGLTMAVSYLVYRYWLREFAAVAQTLSAVAIVLVAAIGRAVVESANALSLLLIAVVVLAVATGLVYLLRALAAVMNRERGEGGV